MTFLRFIGGFLNGKTVAAYRVGGAFLLRAETAGGKRLRYRAESGEWLTVPDKTLHAAEYEVFLRHVAADSVQPAQDVTITARALEEMGYPLNLD